MHPRHSSKRPPPLKDIDYDHQIKLIDNDQTLSSNLSRTSSSKRACAANLDQSINNSQSREFRQHGSRVHLRRKLSGWRISKSQDSGRKKNRISCSEVLRQNQSDEVMGMDSCHCRTQDKGPFRIHISCNDPDIAVDVLYENQRGAFMCRLPLFSSKALGNLDPAPWTNVAHKPSATNITNAQPPDPSWKWVDSKWSIYHGSEVDEDGWLYSFAFHGKFSWHRGRCWNSFVRRRAWIRKRARKKVEHNDNELSMFNPDYFTVHSPSSHKKIPNFSLRRKASYNGSISPDRRQLENELIENITEIDTLMEVLRLTRIDREITEAVENFIQNGGENLAFLESQIPKIMRLYVFQASRCSLLAVLRKELDNAREKGQEITANNTHEQNLTEYLKTALQAAEKELADYDWAGSITNEIPETDS